MKYLESFDLTEEQKIQFIETLWTFTHNVVEKAFGDHPIQRSLEENTRDRFTNNKRLGMMFMNWLYADLECRNS